MVSLGRISDAVPAVYHESKNDLLKYLQALDAEVDLIEKKIRNLSELINVDTCPDDKLPYLACLTGCPLVDDDPAAQRRTLRDWPYLLKIKGTAFSLEVYLNSIGATEYRIPTYFRDAEGNLIETKPDGEPFKGPDGLWYNIRTHYFGIETFWNGEEYIHWQQWHDDFIARITLWLKHMKPFHAELIKWFTYIKKEQVQNLYHGAAVLQGKIYSIGPGKIGKTLKMNLYTGSCISQGKIFTIRM